MNPTPFINSNTFGPAKFQSIASILNLIIPLITVLAAGIFLAMLIRAAFMVLMSEGKPEEIVKAQKMMIWSVVGLIIVIVSYVLVKIIAQILHIQTPLPI